MRPPVDFQFSCWWVQTVVNTESISGGSSLPTEGIVALFEAAKAAPLVLTLATSGHESPPVQPMMESRQWGQTPWTPIRAVTSRNSEARECGRQEPAGAPQERRHGPPQHHTTRERERKASMRPCSETEKATEPVVAPVD